MSIVAPILVVEVEIPFLEDISLLLERAVYSVVTAYDGLNALEFLEPQQVSLIISDIVMPRIKGYQLMSTISGLAQLIPIREDTDAK